MIPKAWKAKTSLLIHMYLRVRTCPVCRAPPSQGQVENGPWAVQSWLQLVKNTQISIGSESKWLSSLIIPYSSYFVYEKSNHSFISINITGRNGKFQKCYRIKSLLLWMMETSINECYHLIVKLKCQIITCSSLLDSDQSKIPTMSKLCCALDHTHSGALEFSLCTPNNISKVKSFPLFFGALIQRYFYFNSFSCSADFETKGSV